MRVGVSVLVGVLLALVAAPAHAATPCDDRSRPWCDTALTPDQRAERLVAALTLEDKVDLLAGVPGDGHTGRTKGIPRLGVPASPNTDGPVGVRQGTATALPAPIAQAATFDVRAAALHGQVIATEARLKGNDGVLAPTVNIMRTPLNGRTFEGFGEDPFLTSRIGVSWIEAAQRQGIYATVKHYAANNQEGEDPTGITMRPGSPLGVATNGARYVQNSVVDERTLREIYLPAFEAAVKEAKVGSVMCSYNRVNGPYACLNEDLLVKKLRQDWGFEGLIMSDWILAMHPTDTVAGLKTGADLEMPQAQAYTPALVQAALATGQATTADVDQHVFRTLRLLFATGVFDREPYADDPSKIDQAAHLDAARRIERGAVTLLRNRAGTLPLEQPGSVAVIGPLADRFVTGGGSGNVTPSTTPVTTLAGIRARAPQGTTVAYDDGADQARAASAAAGADVAVVVVGDFQTEGADKLCLSLECPEGFGDQDGLIRAVAGKAKRTVVVLLTGGPVLTPWRDDVDALVEGWYPGQAGGSAIADVLFGDADPGGRLPATFPAAEAQEPTAGDREAYPGTAAQDTLYKEGVLVGYRWFDAKGHVPAYPFGHGLSYTRFRFDRLKATRRSISVRVRNVGRRKGTAVPQLYLTLPEPSPDVTQPPRALKGIAKLELRRGGAKRVRFSLTRRKLSYWDEAAHRFRVAPGCYGVAVGHSSRRLGPQGTLAVGGARCRGRVLARL